MRVASPLFVNIFGLLIFHGEEFLSSSQFVPLQQYKQPKLLGSHKRNCVFCQAVVGPEQLGRQKCSRISMSAGIKTAPLLLRSDRIKDNII